MQGVASATHIAEGIRQKIREKTCLTASAGVSYNKFLAKLASDHRKPDGLFVITPAMGPVFVETLPVKKFHGVGPATAKKMNGLGIRTGLDVGLHLKLRISLFRPVFVFNVENCFRKISQLCCN